VAPMRLPRVLERFWLDALIVLTIAGAVIEVAVNDDIEGSRAGLSIFALLYGLPLLARRRSPLGAPTLSLLAVALQAVIWPHSVPYSFFTFAVVLIAGGLYGHHLRTATGRLAAAAFVVALAVLVVALDPADHWTDLLSILPFTGIAWLIGHIFRVTGERNAELRERAERLERERDAEARAAVAEERSRIAREMHDVVAHSLSVMVVQAEAAEEMIGIDPERARRPLRAVQDTGRTALGELRHMLGALRESDDGPGLAPQPGLGGLEALAQQVRDAGLPVTLRVEGDPRPLSATIDLQAYRILQEGLTNALKHAGPARAEVVVRYAARELVLEVRDDGRGHDPGAEDGGHGLMGMRERVAVCGGELEAGPGPAGGFALVARLPFEVAVTR
jgi:signal transduction histidine kinase